MEKPDKQVVRKHKFNFGEWVIDLFKDERETPSIKPVIAFIGCLFLCASMVANALIPTYAPIDYLVEAVMIITSMGMGADSIDKFSRKKGYRRPSSYQEYNSNNEYDPNQKGDEVL